MRIALKVAAWLPLWLFLLVPGWASPAPRMDPAVTARADVRVYVVRKGDCLWKIAARKNVFGDPWQWPLLFLRNRALVPDPNRVEVGQRLEVPQRVPAGAMDQALAFARAFPGPGEVAADPPGEKPALVEGTPDPKAPPARAETPAAKREEAGPENPHSGVIALILAILFLTALILILPRSLDVEAKPVIVSHIDRQALEKALLSGKAPPAGGGTAPPAHAAEAMPSADPPPPAQAAPPEKDSRPGEGDP